MIAAAWMLIGGFRGVLVAAAAITITGFAWQTYDAIIDDPAVTKAARLEYVGIAEVEAERAKNKLLLELNAIQARNIQRLNEANDAFSADLAVAETEKDGLENEISELLSKPVDPACVVDQPLFDGLRAK